MTARSIDIAIIGAGPAGLIAAERLAQSGGRVTVFERMPSPARKFLMAGRGGLNLTHSEPLERFLTRYGNVDDRLLDAIRAFPPETAQAWARGLGQETFVGSSGRVFPRAMKASPLLRAWLRRLDGLGVAIMARHDWSGWDGDGALIFQTPAGERRIAASATLIALGGASWPRLGSDGSWQGLLAGAGAELAPLRPSNMGFRVVWSDVFRARFAGEPLKRIAIRFGGEMRRGEALITSEGLEGGAIYALSASLREALGAGGPAVLLLDLRPDLPAEELTRRLARPRGSQSRSTFLRKVAGLPPVAVALLREAGEMPDDAAALAARIKAVPLRLDAPMPIERAISSAGGVAFASLDESFMLKTRPGIFLAGEMLDWEAPTGGYLLQACLATGVAAARGLMAWRSEKADPAAGNNRASPEDQR
jgi:uncharacterized flavoprotein (TIGR03862 family)